MAEAEAEAEPDAEEPKRQAEEVADELRKQAEDEDLSETASESEQKFEPKITSDDPAERKLARRLRIQRRLEAVRKAHKTEEEEEKEVVPQTLVEQQIFDSLTNVQLLLTDGQEQVSNIRIASDAREVKRRNEQQEAREKRLKIIEDEAEESLEMFEKISEKWTEISRSNDPLNVYSEMEKQKLKCLELIQRKNEIIEELTAELQVNDEQFDRDQKKQREDLHILTERINNHINLLKKVYCQELRLMEEAIHVEQNELLEAASQEWEALYEDRSKEEKLAMRKKFDLITKLEGEMDELHVEHNEKVRGAKIGLERDIHVLEHELERVRALCMLNTEKLDYNFQILKRRDDENRILKAHQKRRINKLQDLVNQLRKEIEDAEKTTVIETERLSTEVLKYHQSILEIESIADHFSEANDKKYEKIWEMNKSIAHEHIEKVFMCDKVLHEQQLGLEWKNLQIRENDKTELPSYRSAMQVVSELFNGEEPEKESECSSHSSDADDLKIIREQEALLKHILTRLSDEFGFLLEDKVIRLLFPFRKAEKTLVRIDNVFTALGIETEEDILMMRKYFIRYTKCNICGFAPSVEDEVSEEGEEGPLSGQEESISEEMAVALEEEETYLEPPHHVLAPPGVILPVGLTPDAGLTLPSSVQIDIESHRPRSVREGKIKEITIDSMKSWGQMTFAFSEISGDLESEEEESLPRTYCCHPGHHLKIDAVFVTKALRDFIADFSKRKERVMENVSSRLLKRRHTVSRLLSEEDVTDYWDAFGTAFPPTREKLWDGLEIGLQMYYEVLARRHKVNEEIVTLKRENEELRKLLQNYISSAGDENKRGLPFLYSVCK